jgi:hypothetical protein
VLTAGHCVDEGPTDVWWGTDLLGGEPSLAIGIGAAIVHPDRAERDYDVALLHLAAPSTGGIAFLAEDPPAVDDVVRAYGFGATNDGADDAGVKRGVDLDVVDVQPVVVTTYRGGVNVCSGDSGGPLVRPGKTPMEVVAVTAFVDPSCLGGAGGGSRADAIAAFVAEHVPVVEPRDTGVGSSGSQDGATTHGGSGCRTTPGSFGWIGLFAVLAAAGHGRPRGTRGRNAA